MAGGIVRGSGVCFRPLLNTPSPHAISHCGRHSLRPGGCQSCPVQLAGRRGIPRFLAPWVPGSPGGRGGGDEAVFTRMYGDDVVSVESQCTPSGERCFRAWQSIGSDHDRLLGARQASEPPLLSPGKVSSWHTRLEVLGWVIDTVSMTISLAQTELTQLRELLAKWPNDRRVASESDLRSLMGKLLHVCEVVRPEMFFVRRMLNQSGCPPYRPGTSDFGFRKGGAGRRRVAHVFTSSASSTMTFRSGVWY